MTQKLDPNIQARLSGSSTPALRQLLHNHKTSRFYKCYAYAELLRRKQNSKNKVTKGHISSGKT